MSIKSLVVPETHTALLSGELACEICRARATRWTRCPRCRKVIGRCGVASCGDSMTEIQRSHCTGSP